MGRAGHFDEELEPEPPEALDLHGLRPEDAQRRLELFLHSARVRGLAEVLVITGRGTGNPQGRAVLRERVAAWCRTPKARERGVRRVEVVAKGGALLLTLLTGSHRPPH